MKTIYIIAMVIVVGIALYKYAEIALVTLAVESAIHHIHKGF